MASEASNAGRDGSTLSASLRQSAPVNGAGVDALPGRQVLADSVYDVVKQQIMDMKLSPSKRLVIDQLARELGVSNTPLREALTRLELEGLVTRRSLQGFTVTPVPNLRDVDELFELRLMLEPGAARAASKNVSPGDLALLRTSVEQMVELAGDDHDTGHYRRHRSLVSADANFHDFIAEKSGNKLLRRAVSGLHAHVMIYRLYFKLGYAPEGGETADEHAAILEAFARHNSEQAARAMREHLHRSKERLRAICRLNASTP
jgi:DNA-binding GntR family transcriptional regulator